MKKDIIIANQPLLAEKIQKFKAAGKNKFHIVSDFDKTLTKAFWNGQKHPSVIAILREEKYLTPDYADRANALFEKLGIHYLILMVDALHVHRIKILGYKLFAQSLLLPFCKSPF